MQRDKRGRFVKKASAGTDLTSFSLNNPSVNQKKALDTHHLLWGDESKPWAPQKIKYRRVNDTFVDEFGNPLSMLDVYQNPHRYELTFDFNSENSVSLDSSSTSEVDAITTPADTTSATNTSSVEESEDPSVGFNLFNTEDKNKVQLNSAAINRTKLADFLEWTRAGIGASINNKIAERALEAEKPFLQDVSESHRSVYGDYRARIQGEKAAAQLRNLASRPVTSDGMAQQQMMLEAQIKGQEFIDQGNAQDEAMIRQTREVAWQQEKENQQQRQAVAMQNRQAMLMSEQNKTQIKNMRDSANYSQIVAPLMMGIESRLREKGAEQDYYQEYYDNLAVTDEVWNNAKDYVTPEELELVTKFLSEGETALNTYIQGDATGTRNQNWISAQHKLKQAIIQRQAALRGVTVRTNAPVQEDPFAFWRPKQNQWTFKSGGTIYKATLQAKSKNKDRNQRSIESSKKIAARFLEKALNSLYTYNEVELVAKPKKPKYQAGGNLPFVNFSPVTGPATSSAVATTKAAKDEDSKSNDLTTKDVLELLKDLDGLPSDINQIIASLQNFTLEDDYMPSYMASSSNIASRYIKLLGQIQTAVFNKEEYKGAIDHLKNNGGLHELAITSDGWLIGVDDENNFKYFDAAQVNAGEHSEQGYSLLTNSNLLYLRANSPDAAFNPALLSAAQNGIGMEVITKRINEIIQGLGSTKTSQEGFVQVESQGVLRGLEFLQQAAREVGDPSIINTMSVADYYQAGYLTEDQTAQAQLAVNYIWEALPQNAKALLLVKGGGATGANALIQSLVTSRTSSTSQFKASPKKMADARGTSGGSGKSSGKGDNVNLEMSPAQLLQQGFGEPSMVTIQDSSSTGLQMEAVALPITSNGNNNTGAITLEDVARSQFGGVLDFSNASMGGTLIPFEGRRNVAVDGSKLYSMNLPVDYQEYVTTGNVVPDLNLIDKVNALNRQIQSQQITDAATINQMYQAAGLPAYYNEDGTTNATVYRRFGVLNGTAIDNAFGKDFIASRYLKEVEDEDIINGAISIMNHGRNKEDKIEYDAKSFFNFGGLLGDYDSVYQGTVFIPISNNVFSGIAGSGKTITPDEANLLEAKQQQYERVSATYKNPGQLQ